jgi:ribosomal protein S18 acetylase RimI-like enzyme
MAKSTMNFETVFNPSQESLAPIDRGLHEFNLSRLGQEIIFNYHKVLVTARDEDGTLIGGIHGEMFSDWLHIDTLWVDEKHRGRGIGSSLLKQIEKAAVSNGFSGGHTETTSYQALGFYLKHGYEVFGELEGKPAGSTWYYIKKRLAQR